MALGGVLKLLGHVLGGSHWCAEDGEPLLFAWQGAAANPHIGAQCVHVRWGDAGRIPNSRFATVELDARVCVEVVGHDVVHCTYSVGLDHGVNVIQVGQ